MSFSGVIQSYGRTQGFGFIEMAPENERVFFGRKSLPIELQTALYFHLCGKNCIFDLVEIDGKKQARNIKIDFSHEHDGKPQAKKLPFKGESAASSDATKDKSLVPQYCGRIKSFNPASFGFIECKQWNRDVYLDAKNMPPGIEVGRTVLFEVECRNGRPRACNVRIGYQGKMQSYGKEKGFGFIECGEAYSMFGRDVYVSAQTFADSTCSVLDEVFFDLSVVYRDGTWKPQACNIKVVEKCNLATRESEECPPGSEASTAIDFPKSNQIMTADSSRSQETLISNSTRAPLGYYLVPAFLVM